MANDAHLWLQPLTKGELLAVYALTPPHPNERYFNDDLDGLATTALLLERRRLLAAVLVHGRLDPWQAERFAALQREWHARATTGSSVDELAYEPVHGDS